MPNSSFPINIQNLKVLFSKNFLLVILFIIPVILRIIDKSNLKN